MKSIKIKFALPVGIALIAATASIVVGVLSYVSARDAVHEESFQKLQAVVAARKSEFERYLGMIQQDLRFQAENPAALSALKELDAGYNSLGSQAERLLQDAYITNNRFPPGEKHKLDAADDGSGYSTAHRKYHPFFRSFLTERSYYDIFLFDTAGNVVYTTFKELDFATNVQNGEWKDTGLGNVFRRAIAGRAGEIAFTDFAPYAPSANVPASFIATPLFVNGTVAGVLAFQMPIGKINEIMQQTEGMGETGETYIVGQDMLMRSDSRFSKESTILNQKVNTASVELALKGGSGVGVIDDYRGVPVLSAYVPVEFNGTNFAMIAEIDLSEAEAEAINIRNSVVIVTIATAIASILIGLLAARYLVGPISRLTSTMVAIARGDLSARIPHTDRGDEIGEMARTVEVFKRNAVEKERMTAEQKEQEQRAARDKRESSIALANQFESEVGSIVKSVASAAAAMQTSASSLSSIADATSSQATTVSAASEQASVNV
ncbi:MAG: HAMP domain-containing protein, partial [Rhodobacteraceae bacterium]|nr:HAMP domain-containing protein [Paracoccaceae bacterium]